MKLLCNTGACVSLALVASGAVFAWRVVLSQASVTPCIWCFGSALAISVTLYVFSLSRRIAVLEDAPGKPKYGTAMIRHIRRAGFTLLELSIVMMLIGVILSGGLVTLSAYMQSSQYNTTVARMNTIEQALLNFASVYGRIPCP